MKPFAVRLTAKPSERRPDGIIVTSLCSPNELAESAVITSLAELETLATNLAARTVFDSVVWIGARDPRARLPRGFDAECRRISRIFHEANPLVSASEGATS